MLYVAARKSKLCLPDGVNATMSPQACGRRNKAPLQVKYDERCDIIVHRIRRKSTGDDRIRATFRTERYRPTCTVCQTPIDYRIRPSNASSFHQPEGDALRAFTLLAAARAARDKEKEEERLLMLQKKKEDERKLAISQGRLAPAGSPQNILAKTNALTMFSSSITSTDDETLDSMNATLNTDTERAALGSVLVEGRQTERASTDERPGSAGTDDSDDAAAYVRRMMEAQEAVNRRLGPIKYVCDKLRACWNGVVAAFSPQVKDVDGMLFNDWSFKKKVKKFKPVPDRRILDEGERYCVGDEVESFEHMPTWYPATVTKYNSNGSYVIRFHNGEEADAVPKSKIRYRIQPPITGLQQIVSGSFLIFLVVEPAWLCLFASNPTLNEGEWWDAAATVILLPLLLIALVWVVAILLQMLLLYLRDGREAGPCLLIKIALFYLSAPLFLLIFCCVALNGPTAGTEGGSFLAALILSFVGFLVAIASVASTVKPMYAYLTMVGSAPLLLFLILISLWCAHDPRGRWVSYAGSASDDDGPLGVLHGAREGNEESAPPVLLEGYLYVMFLPAFFTYRLCWWLFHNLPHLWDANFAPPEDWC